MEHYENRNLEDIKYFCEYGLVLKTEQWKGVVGFEKLYQISNLGRVKSLDKFVKCKGNSIKFVKGIILKNAQDKTGYLRACINNNKKYFLTIHRLVLIAFVPNKNKLPCVNHKNGIKTDNTLSNLEWCTHKENTIHSYETNLQMPQKGIYNGMAKLNEFQVFSIRENKNKLTDMELSKIYNISRSSVQRVRSKSGWKHI